MYRSLIVRIVNFSEARNHLKRVIDNAVDEADVVVITRRDAEDAVVMSLDHYNGLMETLHLLENPANAAHLQRSIEQYRGGEARERELAED